MKPIRLVLEGINSFTDAQELDFRAAGRSNLFCICGKTGAGKSTIFDGILLALYGRSGRGNLGEVVNLSRKTGRIVFEFCENGDEYRVEREIRRSSEKERADGKTGTSKALVYKNGEPCAEHIKDIIGLDESEFKNVYLLEQGQYAEFLKQPSSEQTKIVGKIFSLMRFGDVSKRAGELKRGEEDDVARLEKSIEDLGGAADERRKAVKESLKSLRSKSTAAIKEAETEREDLGELEKLRDEFISASEKANAVKKLDELAIEAKSKLDAATENYDAFVKAHENDTDKTELEAVRVRLNEMSALGALDGEYSAAVKTAEEKRALAKRSAEKARSFGELNVRLTGEAENAYNAFDGAVGEFAAHLGTLRHVPDDVRLEARKLTDAGERSARVDAVDAVIFALKTQKQSYETLSAQLVKERAAADKASAVMDAAFKKTELYTEQLKKSAEQKTVAEEQARRTAAELNEARLCSHAAAVRAELHAGDTCPVCGGVYGGGEARTSEVEVCKKAVDDAAEALKRAENAERDFAGKADSAKSDFARAEAEVAERGRAVKELEEKLAATGVEPDIYEKLARSLKSAKAHADAYKVKNAQLSKNSGDGSALAAEARAADNSAAEAESKAAEIKAALGEHCGRTADAISAIKAEIAALEKRVAEYEKAAGEKKAALDGARAAFATAERSLAEARADCPADMPSFDEDGYRQKRARFDELTKQNAERDKEIAVLETELNELDSRADKVRALEAERSGKRKLADMYDVIFKLTKGSAMLNFVATEYIEDFTAVASEILSELSDGKYRLSYDRADGFVVSDYLNGGKARRTATLSGGEMFLASLSVATAIARAQVKGDNGFFFLDEGFGTLDDELIDTVYAALESLSKDCLVGVISHSNALIDRMPSCVEVIEANGDIGSRIKY